MSFNKKEAVAPSVSPTRLDLLKAWIPGSRMSGVGVPLILLWIVLTFTAPHFLSVANIGNLSVQFSIIGVLAIGTTPLIICKEIDLSIGAAEGFCAVIAALLTVNIGVPWLAAVICGVCAGVVVGGFNGWMVTRIGVPSFVVTLGTLGIISGAALVATGGQSIYGLPDGYQWIGQGDVFIVRAPILFCLGFLFVMRFIMKHTTVGLGFYAVGGNERAASLVGISTIRIRLIAFMVSGAASGLGGIISSARLNSANPTLGTFDLLDAIAAVVIGGTSLSGGEGTIVGTASGALLIVTIRNGLTLLGVDPFYQQTIVGSVIIIAALLSQKKKRA